MTSRCRFPILFALLASGLGLLTGCTTTQPWQRGTLADYTMRGDRDKLAAAMTEHVYFSREAASGGQGVGGGGCGCN
jgi:type IV pilus biogenesis protein CpaD/CtpE